MNELIKVDRLAEIISLMRDKGKQLNYKIFKQLTRFEVSQKTFLRDIAYLRDKRGAPIDYDASEKVFFLKSPYVDTSFLSVGNPQLTFIGTKLAETVLPEPFKSGVRRSMDAAILEFQDDEKTKSDYNCFVAAFDQRVKYNFEIVETVFKSCISCKNLELEYHGGDGKSRAQIFSPHFMVERQGIWYLRGRLHSSNGRILKTPRIITLALHRIKTAKILETDFVRDEKIRESIAQEGLFDFENISNVKMHCNAAIRQAVLEQHEHTGNEIIKNPDGSILLTIKYAQKRQIIKWVFAEQGNARIIEPESLSEEICAIARKILSVHSGEIQ